MDCKCSRNCFLKLSDEEKHKTIEILNTIGSKEKQDTYICGLLNVQKIVRRRMMSGSGSNRACACKYKIRIDIREVDVCKKAFCSLLGIGKSRVERLIKKIRSNEFSPVDARGKHTNRPNKLPDDILFKIHTHIESFPKRSSHYSRYDNNNIKYLSSDLNVSKMYRLYLQMHEKDEYDKFEKGDPTCKPIVKYKYYDKYFKDKFQLSFGYPRSDTCQTCDKLKVMIDAELNPETKQHLQLEKELHLRKAEVFYDDLKAYHTKAIENESIEMLAFDFQQNMPLPHVPCGDVYYKRQLWVYNFCIFSGKTGKYFHFMYDETIAKKGQNDVISFINYFFENFLTPGVKIIYLFSDNCSAQNKNNVLFQYLYCVVKSKRFGINNIIHRYPEPGHSFLPCDRSFGQIEKIRRKIERVYIPETYQEMVTKTSKKFQVVKVTQDMLFNFLESMKSMFKKTVIGVDKSKFSVMAYRYMEYNSEGLFCSISGNSTGKEKFLLEKKGVEVKLPENMLNLYNGLLCIKSAKFQDVQTLASKYVPPEYIWFYTTLVEEESSNRIDNRSDDEN